MSWVRLDLIGGNEVVVRIEDIDKPFTVIVKPDNFSHGSHHYEVGDKLNRVLYKDGTMDTLIESSYASLKSKLLGL